MILYFTLDFFKLHSCLNKKTLEYYLNLDKTFGSQLNIETIQSKLNLNEKIIKLLLDEKQFGLVENM